MSDDAEVTKVKPHDPVRERVTIKDIFKTLCRTGMRPSTAWESTPSYVTRVFWRADGKAFLKVQAQSLPVFAEPQSDG